MIKEYLDTTTCVEIGEENLCPITKITLDLDREPEEISNSYKLIDSDFNTTFDFDNLYYTKANFQPPITSLKVTYGLPCLDPDEVITKFSNQYLGQKQQFGLVCPRDERYQEITTGLTRYM